MEQHTEQRAKPGRHRRWAVRLLAAGIGALIGIWLGFSYVLPAIIRRQVAMAFHNAGLEQVTFDVQGATPWETRLVAISAGANQWLKIGHVTIDYTPIGAVGGEVESIRIRDAELSVPWDWIAQIRTGTAAAPYPFQRIELDSCILTLARGPRAVQMKLNGSLVCDPQGGSQLAILARVDGSAINVSGLLNPLSGTTDVSANGKDVGISTLVALLPAAVQEQVHEAGGTVSFQLRHERKGPTTRTSGSAELQDGFVVGIGKSPTEVRGVHAQVTISSLEPLTTPPGQTIHADSVRVGGEEFTDAGATFGAPGTGDLHISDVHFNWIGGYVTIEPVAISMASPVADLAIVARHADLGHIVDLLSRGRAKAGGLVSGRLPIRIDWPHITIGEGLIESEGPGTIQLGESVTAFATLLDSTDPRFATDDQMQQLKQKILEAMKDFELDQLRAQFKRENGELIVAVTIQGRGRTGSQQPLDITLNFNGFEQGLNAYLAGRSRVLGLGK